MKQLTEENNVGEALYKLIEICREIQLDSNNKDKGSPDEIVINRGGTKVKVKL